MRCIQGVDKETGEVQRIIYDSQNPEDCVTRKYFLWKPWNQGMGADIHIAGRFIPKIAEA
jgi:hypothetical protein